MKADYIVATIRPWNVAAFHRRTPALPGRWHLVEERDALTPALIEGLRPRYVFFPHWSWRVPEDVLEAAECVCFHMTDLPYGRGGSPLQNLIVRGHDSTMVSALRMIAALDAGPVYLKSPLSLEGRAQEIFERAAGVIYDMIAEIVAREPVPQPQRGSATVFPRRRPEQSALPARGTAKEIFDHIRMLDAETYPRAFVEHGDFRIEFSHAELAGGRVRARVVIGPKEE